LLSVTIKEISMHNNYDLKGKRVWVSGHRGLVGSATVRRLASEDCEILTVTREELDQRNQADVESWFVKNKPDAAILAAATVGGIHANSTLPANFIYDNLAIGTNVIHAAYKSGVEKLLFLGSACIYPGRAAQPMSEEVLLTGLPDPTNQWYAIAKIAGIKMCQAYRLQYGCDFISAQPNNLYGPGDNFSLISSHVIPALIVKAHEAKNEHKSLNIWGSGKPKREFLYVDDLADALVFLMKNYSDEPQINIGTGEELTIRELAELVARIVGFSGDLEFDRSKPDGPPRKLLDISLMKSLGWSAQTCLEDGLKTTYDSYRNSTAINR